MARTQLSQQQGVRLRLAVGVAAQGQREVVVLEREAQGRGVQVAKVLVPNRRSQMICPSQAWALIRLLAPPVLRAASCARWRGWCSGEGLCWTKGSRAVAMSWLTAVRSLVEAMGSSAVASLLKICEAPLVRKSSLSGARRASNLFVFRTLWPVSSEAVHCG